MSLRGEEALVADTGQVASRLQQMEFTDDDARILLKSSLLRELDEEDAALFRPHTHVVVLPRGERLFGEGDLGDCLYMVISGKVKLTRTAPDGRERLVSAHGSADMFGELARFDPTHRTSTAAAGPE